LERGYKHSGKTMDETHGFHLLRTGWFLMVEELREIEEKLRSMEREFRLAVLRHEFLYQHDLREEIERLKKLRRQLRMKGAS